MISLRLFMTVLLVLKFDRQVHCAVKNQNVITAYQKLIVANDIDIIFCCSWNFRRPTIISANPEMPMEKLLE